MDETNSGNLPPVQYAESLALKKARSAFGASDCLVIGADTIVVFEGKILEKPNDRNQAAEYLRMLSGSWHTVITALAIVRYNEKGVPPEIEENHPDTLSSVVSSEITRVLFSTLSNNEIERYVQSNEPMDKAGAYGIQEKGALLVSRVEGCFYNVVGLPLYKLCTLLDKMGIKRESFI